MLAARLSRSIPSRTCSFRPPFAAGSKVNTQPSSPHLLRRFHAPSAADRPGSVLQVLLRAYGRHGGRQGGWRGARGGFSYHHLAFVGFLASPIRCEGGVHVPGSELIDRPDSSEFLVVKGRLTAAQKRERWYMRVVYFVRDWVIEPISTSVRFLHLAIIFLPVIFTAPILLLEGYDGSSGRTGKKRTKERSTTRWWYGLLVNSMERAGATFIKLGQWAGSRTDLFPSTLCDLLGKLHSNGNPHSFRHTKRALERSFGRPFGEIFESFGEKPIGVGAIAQVYKAVLNSNLLPDEYLGPKHVDDPSAAARIGRTLVPMPDDSMPIKVPTTAVAIKVLHPRVEKIIARDLKIMGLVARVLNTFPGMEWLSFPEEVQVFGSMMMSQVDLRIEANNLATFENKFRHRPTVSFPRALKQYTSREVLIEEYEDAVPLEAFLNSKSGSPYDNRLANLGLDAFLHMLLIDNFAHSDLHPGNIFVKFYKPSTKSFFASVWAKWRDIPEEDAAGGSQNEQTLEIVHRLQAAKHDPQEWTRELAQLNKDGYLPELVFIDAGLVTHLTDLNRKNFLELFKAVAEFDGYKAGRLMVERCRMPDLVIDDETFALKMQHLVLSVKSQTFSLAKIKISDVLSSVLDNVRQHHVKLEPDFVNTVISILLLEGIGRQLDPEMDLFKSALPIMRQLGKQMTPGDVVGKGVDLRSLGALLKLWVWVETRQLATVATEMVDDWIRFDWFAPNC